MILVTRSRKARMLGALVGTVAAAGLIAGCGDSDSSGSGGSSDANEMKDNLLAIADSTGNPSEMASLMCKKYADILESLPEDVMKNAPMPEVNKDAEGELTDVDISGDSATAKAPNGLKLEFKKEDGQWKFCPGGEMPEMPDMPDMSNMPDMPDISMPKMPDMPN